MATVRIERRQTFLIYCEMKQRKYFLSQDISLSSVILKLSLFLVMQLQYLHSLKYSEGIMAQESCWEAARLFVGPVFRASQMRLTCVDRRSSGLESLLFQLIQKSLS